MSQPPSLDRLLELARGELTPSPADKHRTWKALAAAASAGGADASNRASVRSWQALRASGLVGLGCAAVLLAFGVGSGYWLGQRAPEGWSSGGGSQATEAWSRLAAGMPLPHEGTEATVETQSRARMSPASVTAAPLADPALAMPRSRPSSTVSAIGGRAVAQRGALGGSGPGHSVLRDSPSNAVGEQRAAIRSASVGRAGSASVGRAGSASVGRTQSSPASQPPVADEVSLLRRVDRALRAANPELALALLGELDERYPRTSLAEERAAARSMAECGRDRVDGTGGARAFLSAHPGSVYAERVRRACEIPSASEQSSKEAAAADTSEGGRRR